MSTFREVNSLCILELCSCILVRERLKKPRNYEGPEPQQNLCLPRKRSSGTPWAVSDPTLENQAVPGFPLGFEELIHNAHCKSVSSPVLWQQCLSSSAPEGAGDFIKCCFSFVS